MYRLNFKGKVSFNKEEFVSILQMYRLNPVIEKYGFEEVCCFNTSNVSVELKNR